MSYYPCLKMLISNIHRIYDDLGLISWTQIYREAIQVADGLTKYSLSLDTSIKII